MMKEATLGILDDCRSLFGPVVFLSFFFFKRPGNACDQEPSRL